MQKQNYPNQLGTTTSYSSARPKKASSTFSPRSLCFCRCSIRKSIEDRIHADIRNGKELVKKDLDAIFALSLVITTLEKIITNE